MTPVEFLAEWTIRSSILIAGGALLLWLLRVKDSSIRAVAWTAMLCGSLAIPALTAAFPKTLLPTIRRTAAGVVIRPAEVPAAVSEPAPAPAPSAEPRGPLSQNSAHTARPEPPATPATNPFNWTRAALMLYAATCGAMLLRICAGLLVGLRLLGRSRATGKTTGEIEIRESGDLAAPLTLGILRPAIVLPADWRAWDSAKLRAVLAHERSHIQRRDPWVQLLSVIHRALLWGSPLSWFLHQRIVRTAEEASDDAAVAAIDDRAFYAETLLDFMQRGVWNSGFVGVSMARYGSPEKRIRRVLNSSTLSRGVTGRSVAAIVAVVSPLAYVIATAQSTPTFEIADVHASARVRNLSVQGGVLRDGRYELRRATMVDLIKAAYGVDGDTVVGGPRWLEWNRYDVTAKAPSDTSPATIKLMLQALLADRFKLVVHKDTRPIQGFVLSVGKGKPKMKEADGSGETGCQFQPRPAPQPGFDPPLVVSCRNMTMAEFAITLRGLDSRYLTGPLADQTGLRGAWDFDLKWTDKRELPYAGGDGITIFDAVDRQLGLKLEPGKVSMPVLVVDRVNETPTPNPPDVTLLLPPLPPPEFEVASIRPSLPGARPGGGGFMPGGRVEFRGLPLNLMIRMVWDPSLDPEEAIPGAPKWLKPFEPVFDLIAKAPASSVVSNTELFHDDYALMIQALLVDRFKLKFHYEDRPMDAYTLVAGKPKLKKADPSTRTGCKTEPALKKDSEGPRLAVTTCRNITMAQFAEYLPDVEANYLHYPAVDATGIHGAWDFSFTFDPVPPSQLALAASQSGPRTGRSTGAPEPGVPSTPVGGVTLFEALEKQLGLKLEMQKRPEPVFVIDHIEEKPTEN